MRSITGIMPRDERTVLTWGRVLPGFSTFTSGIEWCCMDGNWCTVQLLLKSSSPKHLYISYVVLTIRIDGLMRNDNEIPRLHVGSAWQIRPLTMGRTLAKNGELPRVFCPWTPTRGKLLHLPAHRPDPTERPSECTST